MSASPDMSSVAASSSPLIVILRPPVMSLFESVIIALLAITVPLVIPSIRLMSAALAVTPSKIFNSVTVEVIPSRAFISAAVAVTPSRILSSAAVLVTPSSMFSSAAVLVTAVPFIDSASVSKVPSTSTFPLTSKEPASSSPVSVMFLAPVKSLLLSTTIALEAATVPAVIPSIVSNSASLISALPITKLVPVIAVPVIAAALDPPITAPSIVPPFISAVSATKLSMFAVPSINKFRHSCEELPKS